MLKPKLLDLFCKAGGASMGYYRAGFDVTGVDIEPQPNYPFRFIKADVFVLPITLLRFFDVIAASPPCQAYTSNTAPQRKRGIEYPDLINETRHLLIKTGKTFVIENVTPRILINAVRICGSSFDLGVIRHRYFESNVPLYGSGCRHRGTVKDGYYTTVSGHGPGGNGGFLKGIHSRSLKNWAEVMGIGWMTTDELTQAIPPAYTKYIGDQLIKQLSSIAEVSHGR